MKISKREALVLAKTLVQVIRADQADDEKTQLDVDLEELSERVDAFLTGDGCSDHGEAEEDEDEEAEDDGDEEEDLEEEEDDEEVEEDDEEDEESSSDDEDGEEELEADCTVTPQQLHNLKVVKSDDVSVEFEDCDDDTDTVTIIENGLTEHPITHLRRKGKELHVRSDDGDWLVYAVDRFPAGWSKLLPLNELVGIER